MAIGDAVLYTRQRKMASDPFDPWYTSQLNIDHEKRFKAGEWNFYTINHDAAADEVKVVPVKPEDIEGWVDWQVEVRRMVDAYRRYSLKAIESVKCSRCRYPVSRGMILVGLNLTHHEALRNTRNLGRDIWSTEISRSIH